MKKGSIKFIKFSIILPISTSIIASIIYSRVQNINFHEAFIQLLKVVYHFIISLINYRISLWIIILSLILFYFFKKIYTKINIAEPPQLPEWINYREAVFKKWRWKWDWILNCKGDYQISNLVPYCNKCNCRLTNISSLRGTCYKCPMCEDVYGGIHGKYSENFTESKVDIESLILNTIEEEKY